MLGHVPHFKLQHIIAEPFSGLLFFIALGLATLGLLGVTRGQGWFANMLLARPVQFLGSISFSFYLWQTIVMAIVKKGMYILALPTTLEQHSQLAFAILSLPPTLIISYISYEILEIRITRLMRHGRNKNNYATP